MVAWCVGALTDPVSNRDLILSNGVQKGERQGGGAGGGPSINQISICRWILDPKITL